jgi:hypothetical protein
MDIGLGMAIGTALRWVYDVIKNKLGLKDTAAAWGCMGTSLIAATLYNIFAGGFAGLQFNTADPLACLQAITAAWSTIFGTASAWYPLTKSRNGTQAK